MVCSRISQTSSCDGWNEIECHSDVVKRIAFVFLWLVVIGLVLYWGSRPWLCPQPHPTPSVASPYQDLEEILSRASHSPDLASAAIGFCLMDDQGRRLFGHHDGISFIPASTLKTVTTATALEMWGPDYRIKTTLQATSPIEEGVLAGDLIIVGGGDPMLSLEDLENWVQQLQGKGLTRIQGRILGDGRLFAGSIFDDFWNWGDIGNGYGSPVAGLNLEHNRFTARFRSGREVGASAEFLGVMPEVPGLEWISEVITASAGSGDGVVIHGGERTGIMFLRGTVPQSTREFTVTGAVPDPVRFTAHHLKALLQQAGIAVDGEAEAVSPKAASETQIVLLDHESPPLIEIITSIHTTSDNHETECLYRLLGLSQNKASDEVIREHWLARGLVFEGLRMEDGCGLARADFIRPMDLARLQSLTVSGPHGEAYRQSLLASPDGTLRWKGGAMSGIRCYTGLIRTSSEKEWSFALMVNHFQEGQVVAELRDELLRAVVKL
ncbi:D-alanyl-D-alanine carboxypeptidase / D-alanyl-D-alanine-endopeptidase (penicillin-binding protein 4) [Prosthecobacter debontii]|uniref:D-alanyl-D-alanine carboxypeptidase / D-alanyl-D-alanine-endopeptidase (Penicillin-binding protein 4) n=1 Tax=Prosthecobacter debontii TaxID=48467 RepID=A0A1T4WZ07_9BACT|nr:D-alanyl-D-alanine carboxypeptidase / D-alanyl-D-alanine-endopeptidase (penicillin-binding protein 4) [Prosthecobacter debontii]